MAVNSFYGGIGRALSHPGYFLLWWSNGINTTGRWLFKVSMGWLTWELTRSPAWLGIVAFADTIPMVFMTIIAGVWSDRVGHLWIMKMSQLLVVAGVIITALLALTGLLNLSLIIALSVIVGTGEAMTIPARMSLVHDLVPKTDLSAAIALNSATYNLARFLGPALFGAFFQFVSVSVIIVISAIMFTIFYIALFFLNANKRVSEKNNQTNLVWELVEGFRYAYANKGIFFLLLLLSVTAIFMRPYIDLAPGISDQLFDMGAEGLSILLSATGVGAMVGGFWLARRGRTEGLTRLFTWSLLISALTMLLFVFSGNIWIGTPLIAIVGMTVVAGSIISQTLIQNTADPSLRGRIISITAVLSWGLPAIGAALMGWIADLLGLQITLAIGAIITLFSWLWGHNASTRLKVTLEGGGVIQGK